MLRVAVLGAGFMGKKHLECYMKNSRCSVVYVFDKDIAKAEKATASFDIKATADIGEILDCGTDMVDICLPTFLHTEYVITAAKAGKHILCEKPMALDLGECDRIIETLRACDIKYMTAHVVRFTPEYEYIRKVVTSGELGRPIYAAASRTQPAPVWSDANWLNDPRFSLGGVVDFQIHDLDFMSWVFGSPSSIRSVGSRSKLGGWEQVISVMGYCNGFNSCTEICNLMPQGHPFTAKFKVLFTDGYIEYDSTAAKKLYIHRSGLERIYPEYRTGDGYQNEIDYFIDHIISDKKIDIVTTEDARYAMYLAFKSKESLDDDKVVSI
jgi:predicted dehydrogenase